MKKFLLILTFLLGAGLLTACSFSLAEDITPPPGSSQVIQTPQAESQQISGPLYPLVAPNPANGADIYAEKCAPCHGESGMGDGPQSTGLPNPVAAIGSPDLARSASPAQWYEVVTQGNMERFMPPFPSLNDRQRWDVIAYVFSLSEGSANLDTGKALYQENCAACHGDTGKGDGPQAAGMTMPNFTDQQAMASKPAASLFQAISTGSPPAMPAFGDQLSEEGRWALAAYLRSLSFTQAGELAVAAPAPGQAEATAAPTATPSAAVGIISGQVTNLSGGELPVGAEVMLHGFDSQELAVSQTAALSSDGTFQFENIEMPPGRMFFTTLQHQGVTYGSEVGAPEAGQTKFELPISVYDTTQDTADLKIDRMHLFFEQLDERTMRIAELFIISNTGNKTVAPAEDGAPSLTFQLPEGFQNLEFQDGELGGRFLSLPGGFGDTSPIYPGTESHQLLLAYTLPYQRKLELSQPMGINTDAIVVLAPEASFKLKGDNLSSSGSRDIDGIPYQQLDGEGLPAGEYLKLTISNKLSVVNTTTTSLIIGLGALGVALILGGIWLYLRNRIKTDSAELEDEAVLPGAEAETEEELMDAILALDDLHSSGQLPDDAYLQRRIELKARLKELVEK